MSLSSGSTNFRSTSMKPYYQNDDASSTSSTSSVSSFFLEQSSKIFSFMSNICSSDDARILISQTFSKQFSKIKATSIKRRRDKFRKHASSANFCFVMNDLNCDRQFIVFKQKKVNGLLNKNVFEIVENISLNVCIFKSRFVDEIKNAETEKTFEKSRLIIQIYNDKKKKFVLTQSFIIQRVNQRLIICLTAYHNAKLFLKNVTQIYVQFKTALVRDFYIKSLVKLANMLEIHDDRVLKIIKSLYDVPEAGNY